MHNHRFHSISAILPRGLATVLSILVLLAFSTAHAMPVDHIAAAVNNDVITASELYQTIALNERIGTPGQDRKAQESETLDGLITRRLLVQEAHRLRFVEISDEEIAAAVDNVRKRFGSDAALQDFLKSEDLTQQELTRMLEEQLLVQKFIEKKIGLFVRVTREGAEQYYDAHAARYGNRSFQDVQNEIISLLTEQRVGQELDQYIADLRSRADIRINPA